MKRVLGKFLSALLTVALLATSMLAVSLTASADGSTVLNGKSLITFEGGTVPDGVTLVAQGSTSITAAPAAGHGDYSLKHTWTSANATILRTHVNFLAGHTYQISLSYYYEAPTEEEAATYTPWFILFASDTSIGSGVYKARYGEWFSFTRTYTPDVDKTYMDIIANKVNAYFDDIIIRDITYQTQTQDNLFVEADFADVDTTTAAAVIAGGANATVTYVYDEELGKNVAEISFPASSANTSSMLCFPYLLKAGTTYSLTLTYKSDAWSALSYNTGVYEGSHGLNATETYATATRTFTPSADRCLYIGAPGSAVNMTISEFILKEEAPSQDPEDPVDPEVTEPEIDSNIVFASKSIGLASSSVQFSFRLRQNLLAGYADFDMILVPGKYNTSTFNEVENPDEVVINKADFDQPNATFYSYSYTDIQLYELGLDIQYYIKCYDAEGNYVARSEYFSTSPVETLKTTLNNAGTKATLKTAITDLLVVCDEAAKLFATDGSDLANATSVLEGVDLSLATASVSEGDLVSVDAFTAYDPAFDTDTSAAHRFVTTVSIAKVPVLNYRIKNSDLDISKLSMVVTYTSADGSEYNKTVTGDDWVLSGQYWVFALDQVGLHDCAATITATATYDGAEVFTKTYSFATHYSTRMTSGTTAAIYTALAKLGISFPAAM